MIKLVHIFNADKPDCSEPIIINLDNVTYLRHNYDFNCTNVYFIDGSGIIIKEQLPELI